MCGFAGVVLGKNRSVVLDDVLLDRLQTSILHRGPDGGGSWRSDDGEIAFINRRLKIIDLSAAGAMPMHDQRHGLVITYNGEIYNYRALRAELEVLGYQFFSNTDTETILYAYHAWGIACLDRLDGMFAFALFDKNKDEIFLVRDRMGVKPLYFAVQQGIISFASEIKSLWEMPWNTKRIAPLPMYHYLTFMVTPAPYTMYEQVYKLPAGFYAKLDARRELSFQEWYSPITAISASERKHFADEHFCIDAIRTLLIDSAKKRMVADVPVGAFLSGGLDSSLNVALMAYSAGKIKTFTVNFSDGSEHDELAWARLVAKQFDTEHHELTISEKEAFELYERMVYYLDEPLADCVCVPFYYVAKLARESGIHVVQVGEGADELFFGYPTYAKHAAVNARLWKPGQRYLPQALRSTIARSAQPFLSKKADYQDLLNNWALGRPLFWGGAIAFNEQQKKQFVLPQGMPEHDPIVAKIYPGLRQEYDSFTFVEYHMQQLSERYGVSDFGQQIMYLELKQRLPELLLMRADKMSMANSVEAREPYLDHKLVEFMFHVPLELKFKHGITKYLLKKVAQGFLPDVVINRKKVGFGAPTSRWFNQGSYFPAYFDTVQHNAHKHAQLSPRVNNLASLFEVHPSRSAVQKWVLQNIWALR